MLLFMSPEQAEATELCAHGPICCTSCSAVCCTRIPAGIASSGCLPCTPPAHQAPGRLQQSVACTPGPPLACWRSKVAELDREMRRLLTNRARHAAGREICCCTIMMHNRVIPHYLRVWDM